MRISRKPLIAALAVLVTSLAGAAAASAPARAVTTGVRTAAGMRTAPAVKHGKRWIVNDPKAYAVAIKSRNWVHTPEGLMYKTCVHHVSAGAVIDKGVIINRDGTRTRLTCAHPIVAYPAAHPTRAATSPGGVASVTAAACPQTTNPNWWAESCAVAPTWLNFLSERFAVPSNPAQSGALIFFFPSFQNAAEDTILQPVLTWGANPKTGVTNPNIWYITNWYVHGTAAVVSNNVHVGTGNTIDGSIVATSCDANGANCTWTVESSVEGGSSTTPLTVVSGVPFTHVNGGVMEVPIASGCVETPANGHEAFRNLTVDTHSGSFTPAFSNQTPNRQCSVSVTSSSSGADILWKP